MVVNPRNLTAIPTDRHHLKAIVLEYKIARVEFRTPEKIFLDRIDFDRVLTEIIVDRFTSEPFVRNFTKAAYKIVDGDSSHFETTYFATEHTEG